MSDWRYWITYGGKVKAETEAQARVAAFEEHAEGLDDPKLILTPHLEVEEAGEGE